MLKTVLKGNETVKPNSCEMAMFKEHFALCLKGGCSFDVEGSVCVWLTKMVVTKIV